MGTARTSFCAGNFSLPLGGRWYVRSALRGGCWLLTTGLFRPLRQRLAGELATVRTLWLQRFFQFSSLVRLLVSAMVGFYSLPEKKKILHRVTAPNGNKVFNPRGRHIPHQGAQGFMCYATSSAPLVPGEQECSPIILIPGSVVVPKLLPARRRQ